VEWENQGVGCFVLDAAGEPPSTIPSTGSLGFILSDDGPFTEEESDMIGGLPRVSLGKRWLQGHASITIAHHLLDHGHARRSAQE
ncbi:MAG: hypothetical protein VX303_05250, partial [Candidatus Thermoplasmatota archaeon]|nr:hypothetical protein [Candidatus Thermoplasmatota archaeon]